MNKLLVMISQRKVKVAISDHTPYSMDDTHATMDGAKDRNHAMVSYNLRNQFLRLPLAYMMMKLLVIVNHSYNGEFVRMPCTHLLSHYECCPYPKLLP
ncbi:hypothetical protein QL285_023286 [Trifolium repens]|nr:hypothetical protein QL285_023286 [Trifolium repens]